jgi:CDP-Glycerol:Poly(glycerophosphate) glycerophosphotransferase
MIDITTNFRIAADLVKAWGKATLPHGETVEDALTINGIPFWDVVSPMFAIGHVSQALSHAPRRQKHKEYCRKIARNAYRLAMDASISGFARARDASSWPVDPPFLFLGFSSYMYRETLQPVTHRLAGRPDSSVIVIDDLFPFQQKKTARADIFRSLWGDWDKDVARTAKDMRKELKEATARLVASSALPKVVGSGGMAWSDMQDAFHGLCAVSLPLLVNQAAVALHIMKRHRPVLLLSTDVNDPRNRVFCLAGKLSGVRTLEVQFALYDEQSIEWRFFISDHLAATGDSNLQVVLEHGVPRDKITVTGSPRYDGVMGWSDSFVRGTRRTLGVPEDKKMILFASHPYVYGFFGDTEIRREMIRALLTAVREREEFCLVVKPHPTEDPSELMNLAQGMRNICFADKSLDIRDLIKATDVFISFASTATFHALVMKKPVISLEFPGGNTCGIFEQCGATLVARSAEQLEAFVENIGNGTLPEMFVNLGAAREDFLNQWFYRLDGRAAERIEKLALDMAFEKEVRSRGAGG